MNWKRLRQCILYGTISGLACAVGWYIGDIMWGFPNKIPTAMLVFYSMSCAINTLWFWSNEIDN